MSGNRSGSGRGGRNIRDDDAGSSNSGYMAAGAIAGAALIGGIGYWLTKGKETKTTPLGNTPAVKVPLNNSTPVPEQRVSQPQYQEESSISEYLSNFLSRMASPQSESNGGNGNSPSSNFRRNSPPRNPCITNLNGLLSDIYVRYVQIKDDDFQLHYRVFDRVFQHLHQMMKEVDPYYKKYSSTVQFAGSHYDNLRIKKPDEFDMDIVIDLPLNLRENAVNPADSDVIIEPKAAGFVQLRMGVQFQKLPMRDGVEWQNNKAAYEWMDSSHYLQRSKFLDWFKGVVDKALNRFQFSSSCPMFYVDGVPYLIKKSESGPAVTLIMVNESKGFRLDVDLVPALKFPESRWPVGPAYRRIPPECARADWLLVGKPIKNGIPHDQNRSWRIGLHNQERELMHDSGNLRQAVRLLKKVRDSLGLKKIASYYIKTLFFWEIEKRNDKSFWQRNSPVFLFKMMVAELHKALVNKKIPYFWNKNNNLIGSVDERILFEYAAKLVPLMQVLEQPTEYKKVAKYLLTAQEFQEYNAMFLHI